MQPKADAAKNVGSARAVSLSSPDLQLYGYWADAHRDLRVQVPILDHGYYPRLDHTPLTVRQHITTRPVIIPSISSLVKNGYDVDRIIVLTEIIPHPKHEKNLNYFRSEFPTTLKSIARREGITFILPANDIPAAKIKRKQVLNLWRLSFTPLLLKGKQYVSGRMNFFILPDDPKALTRMKSALNLGEEDLLEFSPGAVKAKRRFRPYRNHLAAQQRKYRYNADKIADEIIDQVSNELDRELAPVVHTRLSLPANARKDVESVISDDEASQALMQEYNKTKNTRRAAKNWVKDWLIPKLKIALSEYGEEALNELVRAGFSIAIAVVTHAILSSVLKKSPPWVKRSLDISAASTAYNIGGNRLTFYPKGDQGLEEAVRLWAIDQVEIVYPYTKEGNVFRQLMEVKKVPKQHKFEVTVDWNLWRFLSEHNPEELGSFESKEHLNMFLRKINSKLPKAYHSKDLHRYVRDGGGHSPDWM